MRIAFVLVGLIGTIRPLLADNTVYYSYDTLGRLSTVCYASNGEKITYNYDPAGNRTQAVTQVSTCS